MTIPGADLENMGGRSNAVLGMLLEVTDFNNVGEMALQTILGVLSIIFYDNNSAEPHSGFPHPATDLSNCGVDATGDLTYTVRSGWGLIHDPAQIGVDPFTSSAYQIAVVKTVTAGPALGAHDVLPRVDLIALQATREPTEPDGRNIKNPTTGAHSVDPGVDLKNSLGSTIIVIAGTPDAAPVPPALPAGALALAHAAVPAAAGAASFTDARQILQIGSYVRNAPGGVNYQLDHVNPADTGGFLAVPIGGLTMFTSAGRASIDAQARLYPGSNLTVATADPTDPRIDLLIARRDGTKDVVTGTPAVSPVPPATPNNTIAFAQVAVAALQITLLAGDITDVRDLSWMDGGGVRDLTLAHQAMIVRPWILVPISVIGITGDIKRATFEVQYPDGSPWDGPFPLDVVVENYEVGDVSAGTIGFIPSNADQTHSDLGFAGFESMALGLPTDMIMWPFAGIDNAGPFVAGLGSGTSGTNIGRMKGSVTAQTFSLEIVRSNVSTPAGRTLITVYPAGSSAPTAGAAFQEVIFV